MTMRVPAVEVVVILPHPMPVPQLSFPSSAASGANQGNARKARIRVANVAGGSIRGRVQLRPKMPILRHRLAKPARGSTPSLQQYTPESTKATNSVHASRTYIIQDVEYTECKLIGQGGSSTVFEVASPNGSRYALKQVCLNSRNLVEINAYRGELELLQHLHEVSQVVRLFSHEMGDSSILLVMELGQFDLRGVLRAMDPEKLNLNAVRFWTEELLGCVRAIHALDVVHCDLKPDNLLVVSGRLKLIDFGIANVVPDYTVNIHRETRMGTLGYLAPEVVQERRSHTGREFKFGKPSDIWSCGCIIYEMVYGRTPLSSYGRQQLHALESPTLRIEFSRSSRQSTVPPALLELMDGCLRRDPESRLTADTAVDALFLHPRSVDFDFTKALIIKSVELGQNLGQDPTESVLAPLIDDVWLQIIELNNEPKP